VHQPLYVIEPIDNGRVMVKTKTIACAVASSPSASHRRLDIQKSTPQVRLLGATMPPRPLNAPHHDHRINTFVIKVANVTLAPFRQRTSCS